MSFHFPIMHTTSLKTLLKHNGEVYLIRKVMDKSAFDKLKQPTEAIKAAKEYLKVDHVLQDMSTYIFVDKVPDLPFEEIDLTTTKIQDDGKEDLNENDN